MAKNNSLFYVLIGYLVVVASFYGYYKHRELIKNNQFIKIDTEQYDTIYNILKHGSLLPFYIVALINQLCNAIKAYSIMYVPLLFNNICRYT
jgi:hypothetical protein